MLLHLLHYNERALQKYILRILFMVPVYAGMAYLELELPAYELEWNAIRDFYEAYVLYNFIELLTQYLGGPVKLECLLERGWVQQPWPLNGLRPLKTDRVFIRRIK